jgi:dTDP-4-dehydrorhamnose reductase
MKKKIVVTGGSGRFASELKKIKTNYKVIYPSKKHLDITSYKKIKNYLKKNKADYVIHLAGMSRPMKSHEKNLAQSINLNIIGTSNLVRACSDLNIKIVYFSTSYVYPGKKGNYKETDPVLPWNNYAWSKLGGECAVQMYKNSLILRACMTEKPFVHKKAFNDVEMNFMYHEEFAKNLIKLIDHKGIINVGGPRQTPYSFAKKYNKKILSISARKIYGKNYPSKQSMTIRNYLKISKNK